MSSWGWDNAPDPRSVWNSGALLVQDYHHVTPVWPRASFSSYMLIKTEIKPPTLWMRRAEEEHPHCFPNLDKSLLLNLTSIQKCRKIHLKAS